MIRISSNPSHSKLTSSNPFSNFSFEMNLELWKIHEDTRAEAGRRHCSFGIFCSTKDWANRFRWSCSLQMIMSWGMKKQKITNEKSWQNEMMLFTGGGICHMCWLNGWCTHVFRLTCRIQIVIAAISRTHALCCKVFVWISRQGRICSYCFSVFKDHHGMISDDVHFAKNLPLLADVTLPPRNGWSGFTI